MSLSKEYIKEISEVLDIANTHPDRINDWEREFLLSIADKVALYEEDTNLSDKQLERLEIISKKIYAL